MRFKADKIAYAQSDKRGKNYTLKSPYSALYGQMLLAQSEKIAEHLKQARKIIEILWLENSYGKYIDNLYGIILLCCLLWKINAQALRESTSKPTEKCYLIDSNTPRKNATNTNSLYMYITLYICIYTHGKLQASSRKNDSYLLTF